MKKFLFLLVLASRSASAHSPEDVDPAMRGWFESLQVPNTGGSCCNEKDCATVAQGDIKVQDGTYWVRDTEGVWLIVPPLAVLKRYDNPTGKPVACIWGHAVMCFVNDSGT